MTGQLKISLPGVADRLLRHGNFPNDEPIIYARYERVRTRQYAGFGYRAIATLDRRSWSEIGDYLESVRDVLDGMSSAERGDSGLVELRAARSAVARIRAALGS